jgi:hypothetical protein
MQSKYGLRGLTGVLLGAVLSAPAGAATLLGTISHRGAPMSKAQLILHCPGLEKPALAHTDERGSYHFSVNATGSCRLSFRSGTLSAETSVNIDADPTQYDFELDTSKGAPNLVRRQAHAP